MCLSIADAVHPEGSPGSCWGWTPAEEVARIHRRTIQKSLSVPDNHDRVVIHVEPDNLECKVVRLRKYYYLGRKLLEVTEFQLSYLKS